VQNGLLKRIKEKNNKLNAIKRRKGNWIGHVVEGKIEGRI